ncbi:TMEM175 family protein [Allobranchiibius sp. CTAmp26]|uniref:TMEM175 family protein n=1 Tax=Allobranchiibius sp. CTAmp26 TaxID=2815214 RepID=UPI001AA1CD83|nr:TMEM175 family protein [Allobranchiibius sp. CTAmp26]MBO1755956.1 DUF1211 domain-containing protein [Allobranchiibius sp. CTAmp26]
MDHRASQAERGRDLERLLTFIDAIVAIAITLLVLPLADLASGVTDNQSVAALMRVHQAQIWSFLLSFAVIARLWFAQHRAVRHLQDADRAVSWLLVVWTLTIVFLPFPTALVAEAGHQATVKVLYIGTIAVSMAIIGVIAGVIRRRPGLADGEGLPQVEPSAVSALLFGVALVVTLVVPATSYYPLLLLLAESPLLRLYRRWAPQRDIRP